MPPPRCPSCGTHMGDYSGDCPYVKRTKEGAGMPAIRRRAAVLSSAFIAATVALTPVSSQQAFAAAAPSETHVSTATAVPTQTREYRRGFRDGYRAGHRDGYRKGYRDCRRQQRDYRDYRQATSVPQQSREYRRGFRDGFRAGHRDGYRQGFRECRRDYRDYRDTRMLNPSQVLLPTYNSPSVVTSLSLPAEPRL